MNNFPYPALELRLDYELNKEKDVVTSILDKTFRDFLFLAQFVFITSETELDYYHQKVSHELPNDLRLRILGN